MQCHRPAHWAIHVMVNFKKRVIYRHRHNQIQQPHHHRRPHHQKLQYQRYLAVDYQNMDTQR